MQKPRGNRVAAGQRLDARFVEPRPVVCFAGDDEPPMVERGQVVRSRSGRECSIANGVLGVVAQNQLQRVRQRASVARAVQQKQHLFARLARQRIANRPLHKRRQPLMVAEQIGDELFPARTLRQQGRTRRRSAS